MIHIYKTDKQIGKLLAKTKSICISFFILSREWQLHNGISSLCHTEIDYDFVLNFVKL